MSQAQVLPMVRLLWHTQEPQKAIALAARMCYSALPVSKLAEALEKPEIDRMVAHILAVRHYSVLRHVVFAFTIEGVSRSFSHQFVRHHVGVDVEQRSQHYRREKQFGYNLPQSVIDTQHDPQQADESAEELYINHMETSQTLYDTLLSMGVDKSEARQVLPNACETQMVVTMNLNAIMNVVSQRACRLNTPEILQVAVQIRRLVGEVLPEAKAFLGPTCWSQGICFEGDKFFKACNLPWQSPTVLWTKDFPQHIQLVGVGGKKAHLAGSLDMQATIPMPPQEPNLLDQLKQGEDGKNGA